VPSSDAGNGLKAPLKEPTGVRAAETTTTALSEVDMGIILFNWVNHAFKFARYLPQRNLLCNAQLVAVCAAYEPPRQPGKNTPHTIYPNSVN